MDAHEVRIRWFATHLPFLQSKNDEAMSTKNDTMDIRETQDLE